MNNNEFLVLVKEDPCQCDYTKMLDLLESALIDREFLIEDKPIRFIKLCHDKDELSALDKISKEYNVILDKVCKNELEHNSERYDLSIIFNNGITYQELNVISKVSRECILFRSM